MKTYKTTIDSVWCRRVNGSCTSKEFSIECRLPIDDPDIHDPENRWANHWFDLPCGMEEKLGYREDCVGKTLTITIS